MHTRSTASLNKRHVYAKMSKVEIEHSRQDGDARESACLQSIIQSGLGRSHPNDSRLW